MVSLPLLLITAFPLKVNNGYDI